MALPLGDIGVAGVVAMFAIDKLSALVRNKTNAKKCVDDPSVKLAMQNNAIMSSTLLRIEPILANLLASSVKQVVLLESLNGKKRGGD